MSINELARFYAMSLIRKDSFRLAKQAKKNKVKLCKYFKDVLIN